MMALQVTAYAKIDYCLDGQDVPKEGYPPERPRGANGPIFKNIQR